MFCPHCGKENPDHSKFCEACGGALNGSGGSKPSKAKKKTNPLAYVLVIVVFAAASLLGKQLLAPSMSSKPEPSKPAQTSSVPIPTQKTPVTPPVQQEPVQEATKDIYVTVPLSWGDVRIWAWSDTEGDAFDVWPGEAMTLTDSGEYYYAIPAWCNYVVINAWGGTEQSEDIPVFEDTVHITLESSDGYLADLDTYWDENLKLSNGGTSAVLALTTPVQNCTSVNFTLISEGNHNSTVAGQWEIMVRSGGQWKKVHSFQYNGGQQDVLIVFDYPYTFDAITAYPTQLGNYSYQCDFLLWGATCEP